MAAGLPTRADFESRCECADSTKPAGCTFMYAGILIEMSPRFGRRIRSLVLAQGILTDHVHVLIRCAPDATVSAFVREAKSESSRRVGKSLRWQRGYHADSISKSHLLPVRQYIAAQFKRHPDKIPPG